jgi:hypothetical protein
MTTLLLERTPALDEGLEQGARRRLGGVPLPGASKARGKLTLDELITGVWEGLVVRGAAACPVCSSPMTSGSGAGGGGLPTGSCSGCGSRLS